MFQNKKGIFQEESDSKNLLFRFLFLFLEAKRTFSLLYNNGRKKKSEVVWL